MQLSWQSTCLACVKPGVHPQARINSVQRCVQACDPLTREAEAGGLEIQGYSQLYSIFRATLGCMKPYLR